MPERSRRPVWTSRPGSSGTRAAPYSVATQRVRPKPSPESHSASSRPSEVPPKSRMFTPQPSRWR